MKESYWGYWLIILGVFIVIVMMLVNSLTTTSSQDYYLIKEVAQASMLDAIDYGYYRQYKELRINKEKFVENFIRRFANSVAINSNYTIEFFDLYEAPPKISVKVSGKTRSFFIFGDSTSYNVVEKVDAILEVGIPKT